MNITVLTWTINLVSEISDINIDHVGFNFGIIAPYFGKQNISSQDNVNVFHQSQQQFIFTLCEVNHFIATTNNLRPLPDDKSGSRRFVCIVVENQIDTLTPIDYPQLYAQLVAEIAHGDRYWFEDDENQRIIEENRKFERVGSLEKMISLTFRPADGDDKSKMKSVDEIVDILNKSFPNFHLTKGINSEVGKALNRLGYLPHKTMTCQKYSIQTKAEASEQ